MGKFGGGGGGGACTCTRHGTHNSGERLTIHKMLPVGCLIFSPPLHLVLTVARPKSPIFTVQSSWRKMSW